MTFFFTGDYLSRLAGNQVQIRSFWLLCGCAHDAAAAVGGAAAAAAVAFAAAAIGAIICFGRCHEGEALRRSGFNSQRNLLRPPFQSKDAAVATAQRVIRFQR